MSNDPIFAKETACNAVRAHIDASSFPCVGAKAAAAKKSIVIEAYSRPNREAAQALRRSLEAFEARRGQEHDDIYTSYVATFCDWESKSEEAFQADLWGFLQLLHDLDFADGNEWCRSASSDVADPHFGFSLSGRAYFLVGMHLHASRLSRKTAQPTIVFNSHYQFERLRQMGMFEQLKERIRDRDVALQGSHNPEMVGTKEVSEARQYSGKRNPRDWMCPLNVRVEVAQRKDT